MTCIKLIDHRGAAWLLSVASARVVILDASDSAAWIGKSHAQGSLETPVTQHPPRSDRAEAGLPLGDGPGYPMGSRAEREPMSDFADDETNPWGFLRLYSWKSGLVGVNKVVLNNGPSLFTMGA